MIVPRRNRRTDDRTAARDRYRAAIVANGGRFDRAAWARFVSDVDHQRSIEHMFDELRAIAND